MTQDTLEMRRVVRMAHLSSDPALLRAFHEGADIHRATAADIFGVPLADVTTDQRRYIKAVNFGLIYGMSAFGLAQQLGIERGAAQQFIEKYFQQYPGVAAYMQSPASAGLCLWGTPLDVATCVDSLDALHLPARAAGRRESEFRNS